MNAARSLMPWKRQPQGSVCSLYILVVAVAYTMELRSPKVAAKATRRSQTAFYVISKSSTGSILSG